MDISPSPNDPVILIVNEDDQAACKASEQLQKNRIKWRHTASAQSAIAIIDNDPSISIVIANSDLSDNGSIELVRHLKQGLPKDRNIETLLISAHAEQDDTKAALQLGIIDLLIEPVTEEQLVNSVKMAMETIHSRERSQREQERLMKAIDVAQKFTKQQIDIVSMVCHEFRAPLAVIDATAQRLLKHHDTYTEEEIKTRADRIRSAVLRLTSLIDTNLTAARMDASADDFEPENCDLAGILDTVANNQRSISPDQDIRCDLSRLPHDVKGDEPLLEILFTNLVSNAVKFSPARTRVEIVGETMNGSAIIKIIDHGIGIEESECDHIFEKFYRASSGKGIAGTGIGLYLCRHLTKLHGGQIAVSSTIGKGTTFIVSLPIRSASMMVASSQGTLSDDPAQNRMTG